MCYKFETLLFHENANDGRSADWHLGLLLQGDFTEIHRILYSTHLFPFSTVLRPACSPSRKSSALCQKGIDQSIFGLNRI